MRNRIAAELGVDLFDIYGLTEVYGPGIAINCEKQGAMHYWDDSHIYEIVDPKTGEVLPDGEVGEIVITTLKSEGAPLIRYRTSRPVQNRAGRLSLRFAVVPESAPHWAYRRYGQGKGREHIPKPDRGAFKLHRRCLQRIPGHGGPPDGQGCADLICGDKSIH